MSSSVQTPLLAAVYRLLDEADIAHRSYTTKPRVVNYIEMPGRSFIDFERPSHGYSIEPPTDTDLVYIHARPHGGGEDEDVSTGYASDGDFLEALRELIQ